MSAMTHSHIKLIYMSGTGNAAWVTRRLAERLSDLGDTVVAHSPEEITPEEFDVRAGDVLGILFPVWGSWAPAMLREFLDELPAGNGMPLFAIACPAIFGGDTAWYASRPLARRGYEPFLYANVFMPNNLYPVPRPEKVPKTLEKAERKIAKLALLIHERRRHIEGVHPLGWLGGYIQRPGVRWCEENLQHHIFSGETCIRCGWCVKHCPVDNIEMTDQGVRFLAHCVFCARCFHYCAQHAIQFTNATRNAERFRRYHGVNGRYGGPKRK